MTARVNNPFVPVTVMLTVPKFAVGVVEIVNVVPHPAGPTLAAPKARLTPEGILALFVLSATVLLNPFKGNAATLTFMVWLPAPLPAVMVTFPIFESEKSAGREIASVTLAFRDKVPEVPVSVRVDDPVAAVVAAVRVNTDVTDPLPKVRLLGEKLAVTPVGNPEFTLRVTAPVNPPVGVTVTITVWLCPCARATVRPAGLIEKSSVDPDSIATTLPLTRMYSFEGCAKPIPIATMPMIVPTTIRTHVRVIAELHLYSKFRFATTFFVLN
ncbi:MAG: hypothetical protein NW208_05445 [Bryobacter sp.]|nr:hypothetical protein [Bryobacter sp.]